MNDGNMVRKSAVALRLTPELGELARLATSSNLLTDAEKESISAEIEEKYIGPSSLRLIRKATNCDKDLVKACIGAQLVYPQHKQQPATNKDEAYMRRKQHLIKLDEERQYNQMVFGSPEEPTGPEGFGKQIAAIQDQAAIGVNVIVATLAAFGIGYYFAAYYRSDSAFCMTIGLVAATATLIGEMVLYIARASRA